MSSRALRRLQREQGNDLLCQPSSSDDEPTRPLTSSAFGLLVQSDQESTTSESETEQKLSSEKPIAINTPSTTDQAKSSRPTPKQDKRKRKSTPVDEKSSSTHQDDIEYETGHDSLICRPSEILDQLVLEKGPIGNALDRLTPGRDPARRGGVVAINKDYTQAIGLLVVDLDHLDPAIEMRRKVGGVDLEGEGEGEFSTTSHLPDLPPAVAGRVRAQIKKQQKQSRRHRKQLIAPRPIWTKVTSALVELGLKRIHGHELYGDAAFHLVPTPKYEGQFEEFAMLVETGDIQMLYEFARKHPMHVDALLVVSDFLRMSSLADASELTERAVYILEKCTLATAESGVDLTAGLMRLPYDVFDNRRMHLALFRHVQFLTRRGCYRTAFEFSKILWSLDPLIDPVGVRLMVDFLSIQAGQYAWFETIHAEIVAEAPWLANWHFSQALLSFIRNGQGGGKTADQCLQKAILDNPWMIPRLADFCGLQIDEDSWRNSFEIPLLPAFDHVGTLREALAKIYAQRCGPLWKSPKNCAWLETNIGMALSTKLADLEACAMQDYRPSILEALPILRHSLISDLHGVQVALPPAIASGPIHLYDPLPPEDIINDGKRHLSKCIIQ